MISVTAALQHISQNTLNLGEESIPSTQARGRILAEPISTDRPIPPYNRVTMDGIAVYFDGCINSKNGIKIEGIAAAGAPQMTLQNANNCLEVMTGAVLPIGTDTVIRYEDLDINDGIVTIRLPELVKGKNIHYQGSDKEQGITLLEEGILIRPQEISIAASLGKAQVLVKKLPKTTIISTGDELIDVHLQPKPHQIRKSNSYSIASLLSSWGIEAQIRHLTDDKTEIRNQLNEVLLESDLVILSGGVSKGKFDFIPEVLEELRVKAIFHKIKQRPGKPLWFGRNENTVVFGLPGNPVSSFVCARKYIFHWLNETLAVRTDSPVYASLVEDVIFNPDLHYFLPVSVSSNDKGIMIAKPCQGNGSGDFINLLNTNALMELPQGKKVFRAGEIYPVLRT